MLNEINCIYKVIRHIATFFIKVTIKISKKPIKKPFSSIFPTDFEQVL